MCLTELNPCHIILPQYAKNVKWKNQGLFYLNIIIIIIWDVVINFLDQQLDNTAAVSTELIHYMNVEENLQSYIAEMKLQFASLWSNMLWNVTAFCVPNSASNMAHLFTETFQVVQETKQHASQCMLNVQQTSHDQEGVQWKQPEKWCTQQQCSCSLSFIRAGISGQYCHDHHPSPTVLLDSSTLCICPFSRNPSWHWRARDFMIPASFKNSHRLHLQHSKQRTFTDAPTKAHSVGSLYQIARGLIWTGTAWNCM